MWASNTFIRGSIPPSISINNSHLSPVVITLVFVKPGTKKLNRWTPQREAKNLVSHSDTVDPVTPDQGVGEPVEEVGQGQE